MLRSSLCLLVAFFLGAPLAAAQQPPTMPATPDPRVTELQSSTSERKLKVLRDLRYPNRQTVQGVIAEVYRCMHEDPDLRVRLAAYEVLTSMHERATRDIANDVKDAFDAPPMEPDEARSYAVQAVLKSPHAFPNYIGKLVEYRFPFTKGLGPHEILVKYLQGLDDFGYSWRAPDSSVRVLVLTAILEQEQRFKSSLEEYLKLDFEASKEERQLLLKALVRSFPPSEKPLQRVLLGLEDPDIEVALTAVECLGEWGSLTTPYLLKVAQDRSSHLRARCYYALVTNRPHNPEIVALLSEAVATDDEPMARNAAYALASCGEDAAAAVPSLVARLAASQDPDPSGYYQLQMAIVRALGEIGPAASEADGELRLFLKRVDRKHHLDIALALAKINANPEIAVPILKRSMELAAEEMNHSEMGHAMYVTKQLNLKSEPLASIVIDYVTAAHYLHRNEYRIEAYSKRRLAVWQAVEFLEAMGSAAQSALPVLKQMAEATDYEDDRLRDQLQRAIGAIEKANAGPP